MRKIAFTLAEVFSPNCASYRKIAFTLAEVLITLAIIGVVAAMTLPTLIANYQKEVTAIQIKKSYSAWSQAFQKILADEGVDRLSDTSLWSNINSVCNDNENNCSSFFNDLKKYIQIDLPTLIQQREYGGSSRRNAYALFVNGSAMVAGYQFWKTPSIEDKARCDKIKSLGGNMCSEIGYIRIDTNGLKKPDLGGVDNFEFRISNDGKLYPISGKDHALYMSPTDLSSNTSYYKNKNLNDASAYSCNIKNTYGPRISLACTARIMENNWKIDY